LDVVKKKGSVLIKPDSKKVIGSKLGRQSFFRQFNNDVVDFLVNDPDHILMSFGDDNVNMPAVQKVNVRSGKYDRVRRGSEKIQYWETDRRGELRIAQGRVDSSKAKWNLQIRNSNEDEWQDSSEYPGLDADESIYGFTSNPDEMIVGRYAGKDTIGLYIYDLAQKQLGRKLFHNDDYDVSGLVYSSDGTELVGASFVSENTEIELFDNKQSQLDRHCGL